MPQQEDKIGQPHDHFCRVTISDPVKAGALLLEQLPTAISSCLSSELPVLVEGSFIDETLRGLLSDRLYQVKTIQGQPALV
ncbi:MAG: Rpn family recombination-promoting nuclease/putative transposase, partial [Magnetococcales bacterium]|nr:Rpn family recombination-promoting nuclease/putative transposase [Magnetococcales bacterium]